MRIDELYFEHRLWLNQLIFCRDELQLYVKRLKEVNSRNSEIETNAVLAHFQYLFIYQRKVLNSLEHVIKEHENKLATEAARRPEVFDHRLCAAHDGLREKVETYVWLFRELKEEFNRFVPRD